jgi:hypothetical protein
MTKAERLKYLMQRDEELQEKTELLISELPVSDKEIQETITQDEHFIEYQRDKNGERELTSDEW